MEIASITGSKNRKKDKETVFYSSHKVNYMNVIRESHDVTVRKHRLRDERQRILNLDIDP